LILFLHRFLPHIKKHFVMHSKQLTQFQAMLHQALREPKQTAPELVALTVRITPEKASVIEELAEFSGKSKQETLALMIDHGISAVEEIFRLEKVESMPEHCGFYLLNTNKRNSVRDSQWMASEGVAAAFYGGWKELINQIEENAIVFLYENGVGIVGYGKATGLTEVSDYDEEPDETHSQKLTDYVRLSTPLRAREIKKLLEYDLVFLKTLTPVRNGQKLLTALNNNR